MKKFIPIIYTLLFSVFFVSCSKEEKESYPDIQVGKDSHQTEVSLNKQTELKILLKGGNGKYEAQVSDSKIAKVSIVLDTLKIVGLLEGKTVATILSHDKRSELKINVTYPKAGFSKETVVIYPTEVNTTVKLTGGGEKMTVVKEDAEDIFDLKWDATTEYLELKGKYDGDAYVVATSEDGTSVRLKVEVRAQDEIKDIDIYGTNQRYFDSNRLTGNTVMIVDNEGQGVSFLNSARPYGGEFSYPRLTGTSIKVTPNIKNPEKDKKITVNIESSDSKFKFAGTHELTVEEVRENTVLLRKREFKILLPYRK